MVETLVPIAKGLLQLVSVLSIGLIIAVAFLDKDIKGSIKSSELTKKIKKYYIFWIFALVIFTIIQIAYLLDQSILASLDITVIRSYLTQTSLGKSYLLQVMAILLLLAVPLRRVMAAYISLGLALIGLIAPVFQSHGSASGSHGLAIGALVIHVIAISFWVGGLFGHKIIFHQM